MPCSFLGMQLRFSLPKHFQHKDTLSNSRVFRYRHAESAILENYILSFLALAICILAHLFPCNLRLIAICHRKSIDFPVKLRFVTIKRADCILALSFRQIPRR
jgi:hypothetical protein